MVKLKEMTSLSFSVNMIDKKNDQMRESKLDSSLLLPGDVIEIENDMIIPCDAVLLSGQAVVNESMMTGESTPVKKSHVPFSNKSLEENSSLHNLFAGTHVIMTKSATGTNSHYSYYHNNFPNKVLAMVTSTSFQSIKGRMLLPIIYPKPNSFKLYSDSFKFMGFMSIAGIIGVFGTVYNLARINVPILRIILENIVLITIVVPPALPIAISTTISFAVSRLKESWKIFCIAPQRISISGLIKLIVFDKTNTLTSDNLDLHGCVQVEEESTCFSHLLHEFSSNSFLTFGMATCHDLTKITTSEGITKVVGDPLDMKIFESCNWIMEEGKDKSNITVISQDGKTAFEILKVFQFKSSLQRMSVIVRNLGTDELFCFAKGSSEMIRQLSLAPTVPANFSETLYKYSHKGYRVISIAYKKLRKPTNLHQYLDQLDRNQVECELSFIGLICLENKLKNDTPSVIKKLNEANIRSVIASGDNVYTVISVARKCHVLKHNTKVYLGELTDSNDSNWNEKIIWRNVDVDDDKITSDQIMNSDGTFLNELELAITGPTFNVIFSKHLQDLEDAKSTGKAVYVNIENPSLFHRVLSYCRIFARCSPSDKMKIVEEFQKLDYYVMMNGDGQNDTKALRTADVGVSLSSESEASLAAPFTSLNPSISCVISIIREGRSALWSSFQVFKYMSIYCLIQFFSVVLLFQKNTKMADFQYLYVDMFVILPTILLMTKTKSTTTLKRVKPPSSLISKFVLLSWVGQLILSFLTVIVVWIEMHNESLSWLTLLDDPSSDVTKNYWSYETTLIFLISTFCTINLAISLSISKPFKRTLLTNNFKYVLCLIILYLFTCYLTLIPCSWLKSTLQLMNFPLYYKVRMIIYSLIHLLISYGFELILVSSTFTKFVKRFSLIAILSFLLRIVYSSTFLQDKLRLLIEKLQSRRRKYKRLNERLGLKKKTSIILPFKTKTESRVHLLDDDVV